jgi:hypothetical protein
MQISNSLVYGSIFLGAFTGGVYKGYCAGQGIDISPLVDPALTYGIPLVGAGIGFSAELSDAKSLGYLDGLKEISAVARGCIKGGLGALVCGGVGFGVGFLTSKVSFN